jgi:excisionase family DNA binding protein
MSSSLPIRETYPVSEAAAKLGISEPTLRKGIKQGLIPGYRIGATYVIGKAAIERYLAGEWTPPSKPVEPVDFLRKVG